MQGTPNPLELHYYGIINLLVPDPAGFRGSIDALLQTLDPVLCVGAEIVELGASGFVDSDLDRVCAQDSQEQEWP